VNVHRSQGHNSELTKHLLILLAYIGKVNCDCCKAKTWKCVTVEDIYFQKDSRRKGSTNQLDGFKISDTKVSLFRRAK